MIEALEFWHDNLFHICSRTFFVPFQATSNFAFEDYSLSILGYCYDAPTLFRKCFIDKKNPNHAKSGQRSLSQETSPKPRP
jgi:hypothetical protein